MEWVQAKLTEQVEHLSLIDNCNCEAPFASFWYLENRKSKWKIQCSTCSKKAVGKDKINAIVNWNKMIRNL